VALLANSNPAPAQEAATELPPIEATTPSPVRKPARRTSGAAPSAAAAPAVQAEETPVLEPLPGTLIVTEDTFSSVIVVTEREVLTTSGQTITESLQTKPGIIGSTFASGANRPIIRGLDSYRVRMQENGIGTHDVAALSEDHAVPIDPNAADRIEVVRDPATLRYGSQAIGGVASVENERIPPISRKAASAAPLRVPAPPSTTAWMDPSRRPPDRTASPCMPTGSGAMLTTTTRRTAPS